METIIQHDIQKIKNVFKILDFSEKEITKQLARIGQLLMMQISIEALARKGYKTNDGKFDYNDIEKFLKENYSQEKVKNISKEVGNKFITNYFANVLKNISKEQETKIKAILGL